MQLSPKGALIAYPWINIALVGVRGEHYVVTEVVCRVRKDGRGIGLSYVDSIIGIRTKDVDI